MSEGKNNKESIFTPKKTVKFFIVSALGVIVAAMILWPLFDFLWSKITNSAYEGWTVKEGIIEPIVFGLVITAIEFIFWDLFYKDKKK